MTTAEFIIDYSSEEAAEGKEERRKILLAFLAALFLHLVVAYSLAAWGGLLSPALPVEQKPIELTFVDLATPAPTVPKNSMFVETDESKKEPPPTDSAFESSANSTGASELPATGNIPLPSQDGKDRPFIEVETHQYSLPIKGAQPQPSAAAQETPQPSQAPTVTPAPDQLAFLTRTPTPPPETQATPAQQRPPTSSYRPQQQRTRLAGSITNRGISSVRALGTPLGRYQKYLLEAIGSRWYASIEKQLDLFGIGNVRLVFWVDREGNVKNLRVVENTSNELFANFCIQSVQEAKLPPMSDDLADTLPAEGLEEEIPFTIFAN
jgi:outer membrane biosynthesis protein TonB